MRKGALTLRCFHSIRVMAQAAENVRDEPLIIVGGAGIIEKKKGSRADRKKKKSKCLDAEEKKKASALLPREKKASASMPRKKKSKCKIRARHPPPQ